MVAYKEDIGLGGGPIDGHPRVIDLWWQLARSLGIPYERRALVGDGEDRAAGERLRAPTVDGRGRAPRHPGSARDALA